MKTLTMTELENAKSSSIWVYNSSNPIKGNVNFTVQDGMRAEVSIKVPATFIPIDLTTQVSKSALMSSPQFRRLISVGFLSPVPTEEAEQFMQKPEAQKEARRIFNMSSELTVTPEAVPAGVSNIVNETSGKISGFVMNLAMSEASGLDEEQTMTTLMGQASVLTKEDFSYLAEQSKYSRVKTFAAEQILAMN